MHSAVRCRAALRRAGAAVLIYVVRLSSFDAAQDRACVERWNMKRKMEEVNALVKLVARNLRVVQIAH